MRKLKTILVFSSVSLSLGCQGEDNREQCLGTLLAPSDLLADGSLAEDQVSDLPQTATWLSGPWAGSQEDVTFKADIRRTYSYTADHCWSTSLLAKPDYTGSWSEVVVDYSLQVPGFSEFDSSARVLVFEKETTWDYGPELFVHSAEDEVRTAFQIEEDQFLVDLVPPGHLLLYSPSDGSIMGELALDWPEE